MFSKLLTVSTCLALLLAAVSVPAQWTEEGALVRDNVTFTFQPDALVPDGAGGTVELPNWYIIRITMRGPRYLQLRGARSSA